MLMLSCFSFIEITLKTDGEECGNTMNNYIAGKCVLGFVCDAVIYSGKCRKGEFTAFLE